ncbi:MAG: hypothetical protein OEW58_12560, partial [Gammaproteobacteria bacterium]|nr:hypothetical protein [Gammaproteobacteria bacterium]
GVNSSLLVDPLSVSDIAYKMSMLIADKFLYQKLSILGRDNASRFDWEHAACQTVDVYFYSDSCGGKGV